LCNFVAPNSVIIGDVSLGTKSSVWFGATLNADHGSIVLGDNSQIQDNATVTPGTGNTLIGKNVAISSNCNIGSCIIKDGAFIGANASIGDGCVIEEGALVAAGAKITAGTTVNANECWAGSPAEFLRNVRPDERENLQDQHQEYVDLANIYSEHTEQSFREWMDSHS